MENKVLKLGGGRSTQDVYAEIRQGNSERWTIQSQKRKYVNGKLFRGIEVGYSASINTPDYLLEEDKSNNIIQITARGGGDGDGISGLCILTQNESGNKINLHLTTPEEKEYWEIRFNPITLYGVDMSAFFKVTTNISGEDGSMADGNLYKNWIVNQNRYAINVYIIEVYPGNSEMLSWSCLDKNGNAFIPGYNLPSNSYFTTKTTGLGSYTLTKVSTPSASSDTPILSSRFNPTKKYPLDLNFYWVADFLLGS
ncbi:MAG: Putative binding domain, N-terminal [Bacteriophage sp.]|nr:MAG: Putative binding domain, N-terminal [Bacteriophage sp.]